MNEPLNEALHEGAKLVAMALDTLRKQVDSDMEWVQNVDKAITLCEEALAKITKAS